VTLSEFLARRRVALGFIAAIATLILARPTWTMWRIGLLVAAAGEGVRIWAAGHLEKSREVTRSGPYRWSRHPLYVGSTIMAAGIIIASRSAMVAVLATIYMVTTLTAAIRSEEERDDGERQTNRNSLASEPRCHGVSHAPRPAGAPRSSPPRR